MIYGYAQYSIDEDPQIIEHQRQKLQKLGVDEDRIYFENEGNNKAGRTRLKRLLSSVSEGDTIVTTDIGRLTYSTKQFCEIIKFAKDKRLELVIGSIRIDCRKEPDAVMTGMLKMVDIFAETERDMTRQKIKSGMAKAKARGKKLGRPKRSRENLPPLFLKYYPRYALGQITQEELARLCKTTRQSISKYIQIYNHTEHEIARHEFELDLLKDKKEQGKEGKCLNNIKKWTNEELILQSQEEIVDVWQDGISEFTPATKELKRRRQKAEQEENNGVLIDFSEFDI